MPELDSISASPFRLTDVANPNQIYSPVPGMDNETALGDVFEVIEPEPDPGMPRGRTGRTTRTA
jgi:hypothetical protein